MAGYSGTPLVKKLGIQPGMRAALIHFDPAAYLTLLADPTVVPDFAGLTPAGLDFIHAFCASAADLHAGLAEWKAALKPAGMLWISWPKRASGMLTDLDENTVRRAGLEHGLVDVEICAVNEVWSGLKFVYRLSDRQAPQRA